MTIHSSTFNDTASPVALVTGGARGVGKGIVHCLLNAGWRVIVADVLKAESEALLSPDIIEYVCTDISNEEQVANLFEHIKSVYSNLNGVVNNAAIANPYTGKMETLALAEWQRFIDTNLTGTFLVSRAAIPLLQASRGAIVNIASTRWQQSEPHCEAYAATKGGVVAMTHALALSLSGQVRVNCISPGWIATDHNNLSPSDHHQHPAGRVGKPEDIGHMVEFLLSEKGSFITGQNLVIDGGMTKKMIYDE